uniref:Uncharacterized protein n=1 Tax=Cucumis sativus TaxID=3659 RepID=A0A0A0KS69_CUCSA
MKFGKDFLSQMGTRKNIQIALRIKIEKPPEFFFKIQLQSPPFQELHLLSSWFGQENEPTNEEDEPAENGEW